uniref:Transcriptional regulator n=1 Tax=Caulobacter phage BL57 TaxID=3348355 RepID=A0AB74UGR5_9VIRU
MSFVCETDMANAIPVDLDEAEAVLRPRPNFAKAKGLCRECGAPKSERRLGADFCSTRCRSNFHNRAKLEGAAMIHIIKRWRRYRRPGDFALMTKMADDLIRMDKIMNRNFYPDPPATAHAKVVATNIAGRRRAK